MHYISVILLIRDGEKYLQYLNKHFLKIENEYNNSIKFEYYFYENDSTDETKREISLFLKNRNGKYLSETIVESQMLSGISIHRGEKMAQLRNNLKRFHGILRSDYVLLLDCDVVFLENTIVKMISDITTIQNTVMVTPYCICWDWYSQSNDSNHYYDSFAFITNNNTCFKDTNNTCMFDNCDKCKNTRSLQNIKLTGLLSNKNITNVKSAFGGITLLKTEVYNKVRWGNTICEHHSFCNNVRKYGNIIINPNIKTVTTIPEKRDYNNIELTLRSFAKYQFVNILRTCEMNNILLCENRTINEPNTREEIQKKSNTKILKNDSFKKKINEKKIDEKVLVKDDILNKCELITNKKDLNNTLVNKLNNSREKTNLLDTYKIKLDISKYCFLYKT